ncbi:MAG: hypothetical protein DWQ02_26445 [Bacteroidetes bacterium]|nr:MAG: hypothetical protein DWQ02_26445 [Bacteroidota bacterium]
MIALATDVFSAKISNFTSVQKNIPGCALHYQANHSEVFCSDDWEESKIDKPFVISECGSPAYLAGYEERYYEFGNEKGFQGYFEIDKWKASRINGDGGVDVTGAPIGLQAEGAGNLLVRSRPTDRLQLEIVIPAEGYLSFNWKKSGGSIFVSLILNGEKKQIVSKRDESGSFFSELLHEGDIFILEIESQGEFEQDLVLEELEFLTNALGVLERNWKAFNLEGANIRFSQFITIIRANLIDVVFPPNVKNIEKYDPDRTGYPLLDTDGLFFTTTDRIPIEKGACQFEVSWKDELVTQEEKPVILRHWVVDDLKTGSVIKETQKISLFSDKDLPPSLSKQAKEVNNSMNSILDVHGVGY